MTMQENFPRPETRSERFSRAFQSGRRSWATWREERRHGRLWASAEGFEDLCELTAQFCEGLLSCAPGYGEPRAQETHEIADELAHANRAGFLTTNSQPGETGAPEEDYYEQRAWVEGFAQEDVAERLERLVSRTRLVIQVRRMRRWRRQDLYGREGLDVTRDASTVHSGIGSLPSIHNVRSGISFGGACASDAVREVENSYSVLIYDPKWGANRLLWDTLARL
jgi:hypothetical protein